MIVATLVAATLGACSDGSGGGAATSLPTGTSAAPSGTTSAQTPSDAPSTRAAATGPPALPTPDGVVATGLEVPWGLAFLPDGSALVAERRTGDVVRVRPGSAPSAVGRIAGVADLGEGGLLGLAFAPDDPRTLFAYFTTRDDNRVVALPFDAQAAPGRGLGSPRVLLSGIPNGGRHNGGRLVVGPDGRLWIGTGDSGDTSLAQDRGSLGGKILRIATDGSVPPDNPFQGSPIWSLGHRNVQGLAFDSADRLWATEFGQNAWDELNLVAKGGNYGWPDVEGEGGGNGFVEPQVVWRTEEASPSGLAIVDDVAYVAALRGVRVWVVPVRGGRAGEPVAALTGDFGRIRTLEQAADGTLWMTTSNRDGRGDPRAGDDQVVRLRLAPAS
ncbi:MAG: PQQ-dependent sugar dehydrogenase [Kineosporiaceae bacterium]